MPRLASCDAGADADAVTDAGTDASDNAGTDACAGAAAGALVMPYTIWAASPHTFAKEKAHSQRLVDAFILMKHS